MELTPLEKRMYKVIEKLGGDVEILGAVGSYKDTLTDDEVINAIDQWLKDNKHVNNEYRRITYKELEHHYHTTVGLWAMDKPELLSQIGTLDADGYKMRYLRLKEIMFRIEPITN